MTDPSPAPATTARILIVDDDPILREMLHYLLADKGFSVLEACDGNTAWAYVQREQIDAVICDINMPGLSGVELCRRMYLERGLQIPTIIITCGTFDLLSSELSEFPVFLMQKPFGVSEVSAFLRRLLFRGGASIEPDGLLFPSAGPFRGGVSQSGSDADGTDAPAGHAGEREPSQSGSDDETTADATPGTAGGQPASEVPMFQTTTWSSDAAT